MQCANSSEMKLSDFGVLHVLKKDTNSPCTTLTGLYKGQNVFIKIFGDPNNVLTSKLYHGLAGLLYEAKFYKKYIPQLKEHCPHFLNYINFKTKKISFLLELYEYRIKLIRIYHALQRFAFLFFKILKNL